MFGLTKRMPIALSASYMTLLLAGQLTLVLQEMALARLFVLLPRTLIVFAAAQQLTVFALGAAPQTLIKIVKAKQYVATILLNTLMKPVSLHPTQTR
jgi:hypothetical protein